MYKCKLRMSKMDKIKFKMGKRVIKSFGLVFFFNSINWFASGFYTISELSSVVFNKLFDILDLKVNF